MSQLLKLNPVPLAVDEMRTTDIATCKQPPFSTSPPDQRKAGSSKLKA